MKKMKSILVAFFCIFALTGCYKVNIEVNVDKNLKAKGSMELLMKEDLGATTDELIKQIDPEKSNLEIIDKNVKKTIDEENYIGVKLGSNTLEDLFPTATVEEKDGKVQLTIPFLSEDNELFPEDGGEEFDPKQAEAMGVELKLIVKMPGKIVSAEGGTINGNSATYDIFTLRNKTLIVESKVEADNTAIFIFAGIAIAAIVAGFVVFKMRKNKKGQEVETVVTAETETNEEEKSEVETKE